MTITQHAQIN